MIHFIPVAEFKIGDETLVCKPKKFGDTMEMIYFISEFQCTSIRHLYIYRVSDNEPTLTFCVYEYKDKK